MTGAGERDTEAGRNGAPGGITRGRARAAAGRRNRARRARAAAGTRNLAAGLLAALAGAPGASLAAQTPGRAAGSDLPDAPGVRRVVDSLVAAEMARNHVAGLSLAVLRGADTLAWSGYGSADLEHGVPASASTVYPVASVTKQFTAAAVLTLASEGRLSLDAPARPVLARLPDEGPPITVRQLLNHTSGLPDYYALPGWAAIRDLRPGHEEARDLMAGLVAEEPLVFPPGEGRRYSNAGYDFLGDLLETTSGVPYAELVEDRLLRPLGLTRSGGCPWSEVVPDRARGYAWEDGRWLNAEVISQAYAFASGGLCSTVEELVAWSRALHGQRVLPAEAYALMTTPEGASTSYGFGLETGDLEGHRYFKHNGSLPGFAAQLDHYPDDDLVVAVLANTAAAVGGLADAIARAALGVAPALRPTAPEGWRVVAEDGGDPGDVFFRTMGRGMHTTADASALYVHPDSAGRDPFRVGATFIQTRRPDPDPGFGLALAVADAGAASPGHADFLARSDGRWAVRVRSGGKVTWLRPWTASDALHPQGDTGNASNALVVEVEGGVATFLLNGVSVTRVEAAEAGGLDGPAGVWVGAGHDVHVAGFNVGARPDGG